MVTPEQAQELGLRGTQAWKKTEMEIDSVLCDFMATREWSHATVSANPLFEPLIRKLYEDHWTIRNMGEGFHHGAVEIWFSLSPEQEDRLIRYNTRKRDEAMAIK